LPACIEEGNGEGGKSNRDSDGDKEGNGDGGKSDGEGVGERTNGALKSALRTSTFKTRGKRVFFSNSSGKRIPVSSGKQNNSNSDSILDGYYDSLISNLDGLHPSKIKAR
jgi:hypothetical protein